MIVASSRAVSNLTLGLYRRLGLRLGLRRWRMGWRSRMGMGQVDVPSHPHRLEPAAKPNQPPALQQ